MSIETFVFDLLGDRFGPLRWDDDRVEAAFETLFEDRPHVAAEGVRRLVALAEEGHEEATEALVVAGNYATADLHPDIAAFAGDALRRVDEGSPTPPLGPTPTA
jgi:hypothetical protein